MEEKILKPGTKFYHTGRQEHDEIVEYIGKSRFHHGKEGVYNMYKAIFKGHIYYYILQIYFTNIIEPKGSYKFKNKK